MIREVKKDDLYQLLELYKFLHNDEKFDNTEHLKDDIKANTKDKKANVVNA